jgi:hypothetical protein
MCIETPCRYELQAHFLIFLSWAGRKGKTCGLLVAELRNKAVPCRSLRSLPQVSYKRYLVAGLIMVGGVVAAWPFRHGQPPKPQDLSVENGGSNAVFAPPHDLTLQVNPHTGSSPAPELLSPSSGSSLLTRPASFNTAPTNEPPLETLPAPPFLPMSYEALVPVGAAPPQVVESESRVQEPLLPSADDQPIVPQDKPSPLWRKHRIVEGDTLPALAQRYLGDPSRAGEIHVANMDRLMDPEILPLGVTLLIPPRVKQ